MIQELELKGKGGVLFLFGVSENEGGITAEAYVGGPLRKGRVLKHEKKRYRLTERLPDRLGYLGKNLKGPIFLEHV